MLKSQIRWIRKILTSWIMIRRNRRIQGVKNQPNCKKLVYSENANLNCWNRRDNEYFLISEWFIKSWHKNKQKRRKKKIWQFCFVKEIANPKEIFIVHLDPDSFFSVKIQDSDLDLHQNHMDPKHCFKLCRSSYMGIFMYINTLLI